MEKVVIPRTTGSRLSRFLTACLSHCPVPFHHLPFKRPVLRPFEPRLPPLIQPPPIPFDKQTTPVSANEEDGGEPCGVGLWAVGLEVKRQRGGFSGGG